MRFNVGRSSSQFISIWNNLIEIHPERLGFPVYQTEFGKAFDTPLRFAHWLNARRGVPELASTDCRIIVKLTM